MDSYKLEKWLWTEQDFDQMGWHDTTIHAIAFLPESYEFVLDIDYIFEWIQPPANQTYFKFWVAPASLIFENVSNLSIDLEPYSTLQLQGIERSDSRRPQNAEHVQRDIEWQWTLNSDYGEINLWAVGYKQFIRQAPLLTQKQTLSPNERRGFSFDRESVNGSS